MGADTKIEWCDFTFNSWLGCSKVSPGCDHCYAERFGKRFGIAWGPGQPRKRTSDANWREPLRWNARAKREGRRYRVFCASLADVFDNEVPAAWRAELFALIELTPHLDWLLLTKRVGNVTRMLEHPGMPKAGLPANAWLGATVVNQEEADRDIPKLLATPAAVRFLSIEPILGEINLDAHYRNGAFSDRERICLVIVGGESGPSARPTAIEHIRSIVVQSRLYGFKVFVKQLGSKPFERAGDCGHRRLPDDAEGRRYGFPDMRDPKGGDPSEWPEDLRVREFPRGA